MINKLLHPKHIETANHLPRWEIQQCERGFVQGWDAAMFATFCNPVRIKKNSTRHDSTGLMSDRSNVPIFAVDLSFLKLSGTWRLHQHHGIWAARVLGSSAKGCKMQKFNKSPSWCRLRSVTGGDPIHKQLLFLKGHQLRSKILRIWHQFLPPILNGVRLQPGRPILRWQIGSLEKEETGGPFSQINNQ